MDPESGTYNTTICRWDSALPITNMQKQHIFRRANATELFIGRFASDSVTRVQVITGSQDHADEGEVDIDTVQPLSVSQSNVGD